MLQAAVLLVAVVCLQGISPSVVQGVIVDESGAVIAGATVIVQRASGTECRTVSNDRGRFELACAQPGDPVRVEARGFRPADVRSTADPLRVVLAPSSYSE